MMGWFLSLPLHLLVSVLRYPLAVVAVCCCSTPDRRHLTRLRWLETIDNDLGGDGGWVAEHLIGTDPLSTLNRIRWLWRNGGNSANYEVLGVPDAPGWRIGLAPATYLVRPDGAWMYRRFVPLGPYFLEVFLGWALLGPQHERCKYVCTVRFRTERS